jgi:hypothetical protein
LKDSLVARRGGGEHRSPGQAEEGLAKIRKPLACLRARLIIPALIQELLLSRDRERAVSDEG